MSGPPVLWLVGSIGSGKSDTSYHVFSRLFRAGTRVARLDLDDVGKRCTRGAGRWSSPISMAADPFIGAYADRMCHHDS